MGALPPTDTPRSLVMWPGYLWNRVLFPGHGRQSSEGIGRGLFLAVMVLPALLIYPRLDFRLLEPDEGRYAQIPREMVLSGDWIVPTLQGEAYLDKPPLLYWLVASSYSAFGVHDWVARIPVALCLHLTILAVFLIGRRSLGQREAAWGAILLCVSPFFVGVGRLLIMDGLLTLCITLGLLCAFEAVRTPRFRRSWWRASALAVGFGMLTKGPISEILVIGSIIAWRYLAGKRCAIPRRESWLYLAIVLAVNLPWYVAISMREPSFPRHFFVEHNLMRFVQAFDHLEPVWYYLPIILLGLLPVVIWGRAFYRWLDDAAPSARGARTAEVGFFALAGFGVILFFSVSGSKLPTYILPAFPALMLVAGTFLVRTGRDASKLARYGVAGWACVILAANLVVLPAYAEMRSPMSHREVVEKYAGDKSKPLVCFPRQINSLAFYLQRDDIESMRSKQNQALLDYLLAHDEVVVVFSHRHSFEALRPTLPAPLVIAEHHSFRYSESNGTWLNKLMGETPWGVCDLAVIRRR